MAKEHLGAGMADLRGGVARLHRQGHLILEKWHIRTRIETKVCNKRYFKDDKIINSLFSDTKQAM